MRRSPAPGPKLPAEEVYVTMPYARLCELLRAPEELARLRDEYNRLSREVLALRQIQQECIDRIGEINRYL